ncbi:MAG: hypothetical protein Q7U53_02660 [Anaerolineaceae bacterium]|nr:hypothetical protein [Anaerolineaceae bacterium]
MNKKLLQRVIFTITITIVVLGFFAWVVQAQSKNFVRDDEILIETPQFNELEPIYDQNGFIISEPIPRLVLVADENPTKQSVQIPLDQSIDLSVKGSSFEITYVDGGKTDAWGVECLSFPESAKTAFNYAASIWAATIESNVPITIKACWANLGSSNILGYSGSYSYKNFPDAPLTNTWYSISLVNAIYGSDFAPGDSDIHITYNTNFTWYYGTDASPAPGTYDMVTVAAHEIAHGLNLSGTAKVENGIGSYGLGSPTYPNIYDLFLYDGVGNSLISYPNNSLALGTLLTSNNLWFQGENANFANGGNRVKMYAPAIWLSGSSYSHLDYNTFSGTINNMMVYAITSGAANHNPGPVSVGILKDLGWKGTLLSPTAVDASDGTESDKVIVSWTASTNASYYQIFRNEINSTNDATRLTENQEFSPYEDLSATPEKNYYYWIKACNMTDCSNYSLPDVGFSILNAPNPPTLIDASDGTFFDKVRISWNEVETATYYKVFRTTSDSMIEFETLTENNVSNQYDDITAIPEEEYYYWIKACNLIGCSDYSNPDTGYRVEGFNIFLPLLSK